MPRVVLPSLVTCLVVGSVLGPGLGPVLGPVLPARAAGPGAEVVRMTTLLDTGTPTVAVVAGKRGAGLVGASFEVADSDGTLVQTGTLQAVPSTTDGDQVDPAPFGETAWARVKALAEPGDYSLTAGGVTTTFVVQDDPYPELLESLLPVFDANADGKGSDFHDPSHLHDRSARLANGPDRGTAVNMLGGFMDAGDQVKFTLTTAHADVLLELAAAELATGPGTAGQVEQDLLRYADLAGSWLARAHPSDGVFVSQVADIDADHNQGFRDPADDDGSDVRRLAHRPAYALTRKTGGADVAAIAATALALEAARSEGRARTRAVRQARDWLTEALRLKKVWHNDAYPSTSWRDDVAAAQVTLGLVDEDAALIDQGADTLERAVAPTGYIRGWLVGLDEFETAALPAALLCGVVTLPGGPPTSADLVAPGARERGCEVLAAGADDAADRASQDPFALPATYQWGTNRQVGTAVAIALWAERAGVDGAATTAARGRDWFLGANPWGLRWQGGYGIEEPYHWAQVTVGSPQPLGSVVGGPAPVESIESDQYAPPFHPGAYDTDDGAYRDLGRDYVTNEVGLGYSAPWVLATALSESERR